MIKQIIQEFARVIINIGKLSLVDLCDFDVSVHLQWILLEQSTSSVSFKKSYNR